MSATDLREQYERRNDQWLAPYAVRESQSGERKHPEPAHPYRTCFQRDRDRILHCSAFRRLDYKTQVFVPHEHDHFRTRLTHTLEVAQVARTIARALRLNEDLAEAVALAHDLGHPPFGHVGEQVLDKEMADHGRFEHNRQSLRIVDYLEHPYPAFRGLNLTNIVRECLAKHETRFDTPICEDFDSSTRAVLEGQLVDLADEIAYTAADLDDALAAGWISVEQLKSLELWKRAWASTREEMPTARTIHRRIRACKVVLASMADDVLKTTSANISELGIDHPDSARHAENRIVAFSKEMSDAVSEMQGFLTENVYLNPESDRDDQVARETISRLFWAYLIDPDLLPERYRTRIDTDSLHRIICDYIAGMTDRFCKNQYAVIRNS